MALPSFASAATYQEMFGHDPEGTDAQKTILESLDYKTTELPVPAAHATLNAGMRVYYLDAHDAEKVLVNLWGNPPGSAEGVLGMVMPRGGSPESINTWGSVVSYSDDGYVSDEDADSTDYNALLKDLQEQTVEANAERKKEGYEPIKLVGWASPPHYDKLTHALHWARDLQFGTDPNAPHTLNYQLRMLGREGVLQLNFVAGMNQLTDIQTAIPSVSQLVKFDRERTYEDHRDGDKLAAYGLAGLIATAVGGKVVAKLGFLAIALAFLKKGAVVVLVAVAAIGRKISSLFRRGPGGPAAGTGA